MRDQANALDPIIDEKLTQWQALISRYEGMRREQGRQTGEAVRQLARQIRDLRRDFNDLHARWRHLVRSARASEA